MGFSIILILIFSVTVIFCFPKLIDNEISFLQRNEIQLVICDATPLACIAGKLANCKVIMLTNLTWDLIYNEMLFEIQQSPLNSTVFNDQQYEKYKKVVQQTISDYSNADYYLQLPGPTPLLIKTNNSISEFLTVDLTVH